MNRARRLECVAHPRSERVELLHVLLFLRRVEVGSLEPAKHPGHSAGTSPARPNQKGLLLLGTLLHGGALLGGEVVSVGLWLVAVRLGRSG